MKSFFPQKRNRHHPVSRSRCFRIEALEPRRVLSGMGPAVADVAVSSTEWTQDFLDFLDTSALGTGGYSIPDGSDDQLDALPWENLDQIRITFSENVDVQMGDLSLSGVNQTAYPFSDFSYDSNTYTAVWTLPEALEKDKLFLDLNSDGIDPVVNTASYALDGEWTDSSSTYDSGDSTPGGDFEFRFNVVPGDVVQNSVVEYYDMYMVYLKRGQDAGDAGYSIFKDIDGDASITNTDWLDTYYAMGDTLPTGDPVGMSDDAPTTTGFGLVDVNEDAADEVLSLFDAFDDLEDADGDLTYSILDNSNPDLFADVDLDGLNGLLILDFGENQFGTADLTIRATDTSGLLVDTILSVNVAAVNDAPVIDSFTIFENFGTGYWELSGQLHDVDDQEDTIVVSFGGILSSFGLSTTANSDGSFFLQNQLQGVQIGTGTAQAHDDEGALSNEATDDVFPS